MTKGAGSNYLLVVALNSVGVSFKNISSAYLTPADARAAFVGGAVDAWVAWDPFLSSAEQQSGARVVADGSGLANYKRYYLSTENLAKDRSDILQVIFNKLDQSGTWVKQNPQPAADLLARAWGIEAPVIIQANSHRSYKVNLDDRFRETDHIYCNHRILVSPYFAATSAAHSCSTYDSNHGSARLVTAPGLSSSKRSPTSFLPKACCPAK